MWRHILSSSSYAPGLIPLPRLFLAGAILLTVGGPAMPANPMPMPPLAAVERGAYRARDLQTGEEVSQAEWTLNQETLAGRPIVLLRENGKETGRRTGLAVWSDEMRLDLWGAHPVLTSTREVRDTDGRPVRVQQRQFDYNTGSGQVVTEEPLRGAHDARLVAVSSQAVTSELVPAILRLLPETRYRQMRFDLITPEGWTIGMRAR
ncbi:MAG TPA: hypothetical protein VMG58_12045, partial [Candidatus Sulfotelmatobacter sp.]|nr:hypothetical protein [Candidatus Sulfotelmatobacter sp.]